MNPAPPKRNYKDSMFRKLMETPENLAELHTRLSNIPTLPEQITIRTIKNILFNRQKNDIAYQVAERFIVLSEHQSTINPNMPARMLIYASRLLLGTLADKKALYRKKLVYLPTIHFYELYIGDEMKEDERLLRLSDSYRETGADLELTCHVINITYKENRRILQKCQPLREYSCFIHQISQNRKSGMNLDTAIRKAIAYCIQHKIMQSFLENCREEVLQMMTLQWNAEEAKKVQEEERQEDIQEAENRGEAKGKAEGIAATTLKVVRNLLKKKLLSYEEIADTTDTTLDEVIRIAKESHLSY